MKRCVFILIVTLLAASCAPVIRKDLMDAGIRKFSFQEVMGSPETYQGKLFILGGKIASVRLTERGSLVEAVYVPVDWTGGLDEIRQPTTRFLALYPKKRGILDPVIYKKDREITLAAFFAGVEAGRIDEMDYVYPLFTIEEAYLWEESPPVAYVPYSPLGPYYRYPWPAYWRH